MYYYYTQLNSPPDSGGVGGGKMNIHNKEYLKKYRRDLRNNLTPAEVTLWKALQNSNLEGRKFRRQHSIGNYIVDFYCPSEKIIIELDGSVHDDYSAQMHDLERTAFLNELNMKVIRFENDEVFSNLVNVLEEIKRNFGHLSS